MEYFVKRAILNELSQYVETDFSLVLNLFSGGNTATLENVQLKKTSIPSSFPYKLVQGILGRVVVSLSIFQLSSEPVRVYIEDVSILLELKEDNDVSRHDLLLKLRSDKSTMRKTLENIVLSALKLSDPTVSDPHSESKNADTGSGNEKDQPNKFKLPKLPGFLKNVMRNARVHIGNIHVRIEQAFVEKHAVAQGGKKPDTVESVRCNAVGLCVQSVELDNTDEDWRPGVSKDSDTMFKTIDVNRVGCYVDTNAPRASIVPFSKVVNGKKRQVPSPLVSYVPHTWLLEPVSLQVRLAMRHFWPTNAATVFSPQVKMHVFISKVKVNMHGNFSKTVLSMFKDYEDWKDKVAKKVAMTDSSNAKETMSHQEHKDRCDEYRDLYEKYVYQCLIKRATSKTQRRARSQLRKYEAIIHKSDLVQLWNQVLRKIEDVHSQSLGTQHHAEEEKELVSGDSVMRQFDDMSSIASTPSRFKRGRMLEEKSLISYTSSAVSSQQQEALMDILTKVQVRSRHEEKEAKLRRSEKMSTIQESARAEKEDVEDDEDDYESDADDLIDLQLVMNPRIDLDVFLDGLQVHVSLSKFSDNLAILDLNYLAFALRDMHLAKQQGGTRVCAQSVQNLVPEQPTSCFGEAIIVRVLEARGLSGGTYFVVAKMHQVDPHLASSPSTPDSGDSRQPTPSSRDPSVVDSNSSNDKDDQILERRTATFSSQNPVWNQALFFEKNQLLSGEYTLAFEFELWQSPDIGRDRLVSRTLHNLAWTGKSFDGSSFTAWLQLSDDAGSLLVQFSPSVPVLPKINRPYNSLPDQVDQWNSPKVLTFDFVLGDLRIQTITKVHSATMGDGYSSLKSKTVHVNPTIDILKIDHGTYALLVLDRKRLFQWAFDRSPHNPDNHTINKNPSDVLGQIPAFVYVHLPNVFILFSRWQIVFLLSRVKEIYFENEEPSHLAPPESFIIPLGQDVNTATNSSLQQPPIEYLRGLVARGLDESQVPLSVREYLEAEHAPRQAVIGSTIQQYQMVTPESIPFVIECYVTICQAKAGFTWGNGSATAIKDGSHLDAHGVSILVATNARIKILSHAKDSSQKSPTGAVEKGEEVSILCDISLGSFGIMDESNPERPVLTRRNFRNTDFQEQADSMLTPMLKAKIIMPYYWAYNWNVDNREAVQPPKSVKSRLSVSVELNEWAIETPALQYTVPGLLGGVMPLAKLIELPDLPCLAFLGLNIDANLDLSVYLAENLDSTFGSCVFFFDLVTGIAGEIDASTDLEKLTATVEASFGLCRLSRKSQRYYSNSTTFTGLQSQSRLNVNENGNAGISTVGTLQTIVEDYDEQLLGDDEIELGGQEQVTKSKPSMPTGLQAISTHTIMEDDDEEAEGDVEESLEEKQKQGSDEVVVDLEETRSRRMSLERKKGLKSFRVSSSGEQIVTQIDPSYLEDDSRESVWKLTHRILTRFKGTFIATYQAQNEDIGEVFSDIQVEPFMCYFWIHDMALFFSVFANFSNDFFVLERQITEILAFDLPEGIRESFQHRDFPSPPEDSTKWQANASFFDRDSRSRSQRSLRSSITQSERNLLREGYFGEQALETGEEPPPVLKHVVCVQPIFQFPFSYNEVKKLEFELVDSMFAFSLVIGQGDLPVLRTDFGILGVWHDSNITLSMEVAIAFFDAKRAGWQPVVEPWKLDATVVFEKMHLGRRNVHLKGAGVLADEVFNFDVSEEFVQTMVHVIIEGIRFVDDTAGRVVTNFYPPIDEDVKHKHQFEVWNFTNETMYFQHAKQQSGEGKKGQIDATWDLLDDFETIGADEHLEVTFWEEDDALVLGDEEYIEDNMLPKFRGNAHPGSRILEESWDKTVEAKHGKGRKCFMRIKFAHYDDSFQSYLIRVDRVGDYVLKLGNGNLLRIAIGTRNGVVRKIKFLSTVSLANRTTKDVWLVRHSDGEEKGQPLSVLKTVFAPLIMTDPALKFYYDIRVTPFQQAKSRLRRFSDGDESLLRVSLDEIPLDGTSKILRSEHFMCAVEYDFLDLESMEDLVDENKETVFTKTLADLKPRWVKELGSRSRSKKRQEEKRLMELARKKDLRAVQIVLKPLFSLVNTLPVSVIVMPQYEDVSRSVAKYVPSGARFVSEDTSIIAIQVKIPSEDSEWSLPIAIRSLAPEKLSRRLSDLPSCRDSMTPLLKHQKRVVPTTLNKVEDQFRQIFSDSSATSPSSKEDLPLNRRHGTVYESKMGSTLEERASQAAKRDTSASLNDFCNNFSFPIARRFHSDTVRAGEGKDVLSVRVIRLADMQKPMPKGSGLRKVTVLFGGKVLSTVATDQVVTSDNPQEKPCIYFEETLTFFFDASNPEFLARPLLHAQVVDVVQGPVPVGAFANRQEHLVELGVIPLSSLASFEHRACVMEMYPFDEKKISVDIRGPRAGSRFDEREHSVLSLEIRVLSRKKQRVRFSEDSTRRPMLGSPGMFSSGPIRTAMNRQDDEGIENQFSFGVVRDMETNTDTNEFESASDLLSDYGEMDLVEEEDLAEYDMESMTPITPGQQGSEILRRRSRRSESDRKYSLQWNGLNVQHALNTVYRERGQELLGKERDISRDFESWDRVVDSHDRRRPSIAISAQVTNAMDTGFRVALFCNEWFVNESTVPVVLQRAANQANQLQSFIVDPQRSVLLPPHLSGPYQMSLKRDGEHTSTVMPVPLTSSMMTFKFKNFVQGRSLVTSSFFITSVSQGQSPFRQTKVIRLYHSIYISNKTKLQLELRPEGSYRRLGAAQIPPGKEKQPWHFGCSKMQIRIRQSEWQNDEGEPVEVEGGQDNDSAFLSPIASPRTEKGRFSPGGGGKGLGETFPITDWSGLLDLESEVFKESSVSLPLGLFDVDGNPKQILRVVVSRTAQADNTRFVTFMEDSPPTYIVNNQSRRTIIFHQNEKDDLASHEIVLEPTQTRQFGWAFPSDPKKTLVVRMILTAEDKKGIHDKYSRLVQPPDEISHAYRLDDVGKKKSKFFQHVEMHCEINVFGSSREILITGEDEQTEQLVTMEEGRGSITDAEVHDIVADSRRVTNQYVVVCRVLEAKNIGVPRGKPIGTPFVTISCGPSESHRTQGGELFVEQFQGGGRGYYGKERKPEFGKPIGRVRWMDRPFEFGFDVQKPKHIRFDVYQPVEFGEQRNDNIYNEAIGHLEVPIYDEFYETRDIARILPGFVPLTQVNSMATNHKDACLSFELYLLSNFNDSSQEIPQMLRAKFAGFSVTIINNKRRTEELHLKITGVDIGVQRAMNGRVAFTLRMDWLQVDNNMPLVQNRICVTPVLKDVRLLELYFVLGALSMNVTTIDTFQLVLQSLVVDIDEKFLDSILRVSAACIEHQNDLLESFHMATNAINGTFSGKRSSTYGFVEESRSGETLVVIENERDPQHSFTQSVHTYFSMQPLHSVDLIRELEKSLSAHMFYIRELHIYPMKVTLSFFFKFGDEDFFTQYQKPALKSVKGFLAAFLKWSDVVIRFGEVQETNLFRDPVSIVTKIASKYVFMLSKQVWKGIGGLEILGNPQHLVERILSSIVQFSSLPILSFRAEGVEAGSRATGEAFASLMVTCVAAPVESASRITGSFATLLEGTRPVRHLGLPFRFITNSLEFSQQCLEFMDPLHETYYAIADVHDFDQQGFYHLRRGLAKHRGVQAPVHKMDISNVFSWGASSTDMQAVALEEEVAQPREQQSQANGNRKNQGQAPVGNLQSDANGEIVINVFDKTFVGLSEEAVEMNEKSQFHINHSIHLCLLLIPGVNFFWFFIYILHCIGVLQWF